MSNWRRSLQVHVDGAPVGHVGGGAACPGCSTPRPRASASPPRGGGTFSSEMPARAEVELLGLLPGLAEAAGRLWRSRAGLSSSSQALRLLGVCRSCARLYAVDHAVHGREVRVGLHGVGVRGEVGRQLLRHRLACPGPPPRAAALHPAHEGAPQLLQLRVGGREVLLLLLEDGVVCERRFGLVVRFGDSQSASDLLVPGVLCAALPQQGSHAL